MHRNGVAWTIDKAHSDVEFAVRHMMIATVKGRFADVEGSLELDAEHATEALGTVTIQVASIDTRNPDRDAHLRSADFFDAARYPTMTYRIRGVERLDGEALRLVGDLTIRGTTREVALAVTPGGEARDPWGNMRIGYSAFGSLNRRDFGLTWNQALETGGVLVGDEVKIALNVELVREAEEPEGEAVGASATESGR